MPVAVAASAGGSPEKKPDSSGSEQLDSAEAKLPVRKKVVEHYAFTLPLPMADKVEAHARAHGITAPEMVRRWVEEGLNKPIPTDIVTKELAGQKPVKGEWKQFTSGKNNPTTRELFFVRVELTAEEKKDVARMAIMIKGFSDVHGMNVLPLVEGKMPLCVYDQSIMERAQKYGMDKSPKLREHSLDVRLSQQIENGELAPTVYLIAPEHVLKLLEISKAGLDSFAEQVKHARKRHNMSYGGVLDDEKTGAVLNDFQLTNIGRLKVACEAAVKATRKS